MQGRNDIQARVLSKRAPTMHILLGGEYAINTPPVRYISCDYGKMKSRERTWDRGSVNPLSLISYFTRLGSESNL